MTFSYTSANNLIVVSDEAALTLEAIRAFAAQQGLEATVAAQATFSEFRIPAKVELSNSALSLDDDEQWLSNRTTNWANHDLQGVAGEITLKAGSSWEWKGETTLTRPLSFACKSGATSAYRHTIVVDGSSIDWNNGVLYSPDRFRAQYGSTVKMRNMTWHSEKTVEIRFEQGVTVDVVDLTAYGGTALFSGGGQEIVNFKGFRPIRCTIGISAFKTTGNRNAVTLIAPNGDTAGYRYIANFIENYAGEGCTIDAVAFRNTAYILYNNEAGAGITVGHNRAVPQNAHNGNAVTHGYLGEGACAARSNLVVTVTDASGTPVAGAKIYHKDNPAGAHAPYEAAITYQATTDAAGQVELDILLGWRHVFYDDDPGPQNLIRRSATQSDDLYSFQIAAYGYELAELTAVDLAGTGLKQITKTLITDTKIDADSSTVGAYASADTPQKAYDGEALALLNRFAGQKVRRLDREDETLISKSNIHFDSEAEAVVAYDAASDTVTIKAREFTGNVTTLKKVSFANDEVVAGGIIDQDGDSFLSFEDVDSWTVYASASDRAAATSPLASGSGAIATYRFKYTDKQTFYLKLIKNGKGFEENVSPPALGETVVSLAIEALLLTLATAEQNAEAVYAKFTDASNADAFKADVSTLQTQATTAGSMAIKQHLNKFELAPETWVQIDSGMVPASRYRIEGRGVRLFIGETAPEDPGAGWRVVQDQHDILYSGTALWARSEHYSDTIHIFALG